MDLEQQLIKQYITDPEDLEREISEVSANAARQLAFAVDNTATFEFGGSTFIAKGRADINRRTLNFVISNETTRSIAGNKYIPFTISCELDNDFTLIENYKAVFSAFLRHITNTERPEVLEG